MSEYSREKETTKLEKYLSKKDRRDFVDEIRGAAPEQLEAKLLGLAKHAQEITNTKDSDEELKKACDHKTQLEAPYKEQKLMNSKLARFCALIMKEKE